MNETTPLSQEEIKELSAKGWKDPVWFCRFFLQKWFPTPMPPIHRAILAILLRRGDFLEGDPDLQWVVENFIWFYPEDIQRENPQAIFEVDEQGGVTLVLGKYTLILMPRGLSKTTLLNAANVFNICYQEHKFPFYVSKTMKHSSKQLSAVTKQLVTNVRIKAVFGEVKPPQRNDSNLRWSESDGFIQTLTGISMAAVGRGGQSRGMLDDGQRPTPLFIDDLEDQESTKTDERRADTVDWFTSDLLPVLPEQDPNASATMLANLVHADCLAVKLMADPEWTVVVMGLLDRKGEPVWPLLFDKRKIERKKRSYALLGKIHRFYMEYFNVIRAPEKAKFKKEYFRYFPWQPAKTVTYAIAIDPAISDESDADYCVVSVVAMREDGVIHLLEQKGDIGMTPRQQIDLYFSLVKKYGMHKMPGSKYGVESIAYQKALVHLLREEMFRKKIYFEIVPISHGNTGKIERIEGILQPRYANGFIAHARLFPELETSLLDWPNTKKDWADSAAMAISLLDDAAPFALEEEESLEEDEYESLESLYKGDWRPH